MRKLAVVLATLATVGVVVPTIANAQDKPMADKGDMDMHKGMHHKTTMHHKMHMKHHKTMMKKDSM